jgi:hypothetical protein
MESLKYKCGDQPGEQYGPETKHSNKLKPGEFKRYYGTCTHVPEGKLPFSVKGVDGSGIRVEFPNGIPNKGDGILMVIIKCNLEDDMDNMGAGTMGITGLRDIQLISITDGVETPYDHTFESDIYITIGTCGIGMLLCDIKMVTQSPGEIGCKIIDSDIKWLREHTIKFATRTLIPFGFVYKRDIIELKYMPFDVIKRTYYALSRLYDILFYG